MAIKLSRNRSNLFGAEILHRKGYNKMYHFRPEKTIPKIRPVHSDQKKKSEKSEFLKNFLKFSKNDKI